MGDRPRDVRGSIQGTTRFFANHTVVVDDEAHSTMNAIVNIMALGGNEVGAALSEIREMRNSPAGRLFSPACPCCRKVCVPAHCMDTTSRQEIVAIHTEGGR